MKAFLLKENGGIENLIASEIPIPSIKPTEVLVEVKAISINPVDAFVRQNPQALANFLQPSKDEDTIILGWDVAGVVVEVGTEVTAFKKGDEVVGMVNFKGHGKAYAEYVAAPASHLAMKPANVSFQEAAAATLAALTAWQALVTHGKVKKGDKVLIHAAAGGVGHYAVQIAKHLGAYVVASSSAANKAFVLNLGADEFIDYTNEIFEDKIKNADLVLDSIYGDHLLRSLDAVKNGGRIISLLTFFEGEIAEKAKKKNVSGTRISVASNGKDMKEITSLLADGKIKSTIHSEYDFADLGKAHQQVESRRTRGKVIVAL